VAVVGKGLEAHALTDVAPYLFCISIFDRCTTDSSTGLHPWNSLTRSQDPSTRFARSGWLASQTSGERSKEVELLNCLTKRLSQDNLLNI